MIRGSYKEHLKIRIKKNVIINSEGCWIWKLGLNKDGYGLIKAYDKTMQAHVVSAIAFLDYDNSPGKQVNHKRECINRNCVNPEHLYIGTHTQNMRDKVVDREEREECKHGHKLIDVNVYIYNGYRYCKLCMLARSRKQVHI